MCDDDDFQAAFCEELNIALKESSAVSQDDGIVLKYDTSSALTKLNSLTDGLTPHCDDVDVSYMHLSQPHKRVAMVRLCFTQHRPDIINLLDDEAVQWVKEMDKAGIFQAGHKVDGALASMLMKEKVDTTGRFPEWVGVMSINGDLRLGGLLGASECSVPESLACISVSGTLDLSDNNITDLPFPLNELRVESDLILSGNRLREINLSGDLYVTGNFDLSRNDLRVLTDEFITNVIVVGDLNISDNPLLRIDAEVLGMAIQGRIIARGIVLEDDVVSLMDNLVVTDETEKNKHD